MPRRNKFKGILEVVGGNLELEPQSSFPTGRNVNDVHLDDGTNTASGKPGWMYLVSTGPDIWDDIGGGGSALAVEDEGVTEESDTTILNFTGAGVTATSVGGGQVDVDVPGGGGGSSPFEVDVTEDAIQPITADIGRSFIIGSQSMDDSGLSNDHRMFYDKSNGAFRAGVVVADQWDSANRGAASFACGVNTIASGIESHASGEGTQATGNWSHAEGRYTTASGTRSHAEGYNTTASGANSHAQGRGTVSSGLDGRGSHAEGYNTTSDGNWGCHAEGSGTYSSGNATHSEGKDTHATGHYSHAEGLECVASGASSHAQGASTTASGLSSHAQGRYTTASSEATHAMGRFSTARLKYSKATAGNRFSANGDGQNLSINCGTTTTDAAPKELSLDYAQASSDITIFDAYSWAFTVRLQGRDANGSDCYMALFEGLVVATPGGGFPPGPSQVLLVPGPSPLAPRVTFVAPGASTWSSQIIDDTAGNSFKIQVTGAAGITIRWVAEIFATEVYGVIPLGP